MSTAGKGLLCRDGAGTGSEMVRMHLLGRHRMR